MIKPTITDVLLAARFLKGRIHRTPTEYSIPFSNRVGTAVYVKWENQQMCRSFKIRGALNKMFSLTEEERSRGVVTASSGNHAQGVATAARMLRTKAIICVPGMCPETKRDAIRNLGGEYVDLRVIGHFYNDAEDESFRLRDEEGLTYVSAFEDLKIAAGQGTLALEMLMDEPELDIIFCPISGGGLISGVITAAQALRPGIQVWGVHASANPAWPEAFRQDRVVPVDEDETIADALCGGASQPLFEYLKERLAGIIAVSEDELEEAMAFTHHHHHQVIEGGAATSLAGLFSGKVNVTGMKVGLVISGGNVDDGKLVEILHKYS
ncbi:MAG: threonine/serine dehydratase [Synergistales bacterium]|nr:threonine/serine dehydratase [Synergistales bacterium]